MISKISSHLGPGSILFNGGSAPSLVLNLDAGNPLSYSPGLSPSGIWYDLTNLNNDIFFYGGLNGVTFSSSYLNLTNFTGAFEFDGVSAYGQLISGTAIPLEDSHYTIESWIQVNDWSAGGIIGWGNYSTFSSANAIGLDHGSVYNVWGTGNSLITPSVTFSTTYWYNVAATYDGTSRTIYINGITQSQDTPGTTHSVLDSNLFIGYFGQYFNGKISSIKVWNKNLSSTQLLNSFNSNKSKYGYDFGSMTFDDTQNSYLSSYSNDYAFGTNDFTIEAFFKAATSSASAAGVISIRDSGVNPGVYINTQLSNTSAPLIEFGAGGSSLTYTASIDEWYHVAISRTGATSSFFVNGDLFNEVFDNYFYGNNDLVVGRYYTDYDYYYFNGVISNVRVLNGTGLYTGTFSPPSVQLSGTESNTKLLITSQEIEPGKDITGLNSVTASKIGWTSSLPYIAAPYISDHLELYVDAGLPSSYPGIGTMISGSIQFGGTDQYISTDVTAPGTSSVTYEMWFYQTNNTPSTQGLLQTRTNTTGGDGIDVSVVSGQIFIGTSGYGLISGGVINLNTWYHLAIVRDGNTAWTAYLNGKSFGTFDFIDTTGTQLSIGRKSATLYNEFFIGYISNFRYVSGNAVYTTDFNSKTLELSAISGTDLLLNTSLNDSSGNNRTISNPNGVTFTSFAPVGLYDLSPNGFDMLIGTGSVWSSTLGGIINFDGSYSGPIDFDGPVSTINIVGVTHSTGYTMETMVKFNSTSGNQGIFTFCGSVWSGSGYIDLQLEGSSLRWEAITGGGSSFNPTYTFATGTWYHIVATYDGSFLVVYLNGTMIGSYSQSGSINTSSTAKFVLGSWDGPLNGSIGFVRFYSKPLLAADVTNNFDANKNRFGL